MSLIQSINRTNDVHKQQILFFIVVYEKFIPPSKPDHILSKTHKQTNIFDSYSVRVGFCTMMN